MLRTFVAVIAYILNMAATSLKDSNYSGYWGYIYQMFFPLSLSQLSSIKSINNNIMLRIACK